jgi:hypothetical protein
VVSKPFRTMWQSYLSFHNVVLILEMNAIFIDELTTVHVFRKVHTVLASKCSAVQLADPQGLVEIRIRKYLK